MFANWKRLSIITISLLFLVGSAAAMEFSQAPMLDQLVADGVLPPVEERLPEDYYVVEAVDSIGQYGGTLRTVTLAPTAYGDDTMLVSFPTLLKPSEDGTELQPEIAKDVYPNEDMSVWTMELRRGLRWSDGEPFNVDDIMFWYESELRNEEYTTWLPAHWSADGEWMELDVIDDYTIEFHYAAPKPFFAKHLVHDSVWSMLIPKHYLKNFHPDYVPYDELQERYTEAGHDNWIQYYGAHRWEHVWGMPLNKEIPTLASYVLEESTGDRRIYTRNPYFYKVDEEGNQLPYVDRIETEIASDMEVVQGMIMSGQLDFVGNHADVQNYPLYRSHEGDGNYTTMLWETGMGSDVIYQLNQTVEDEVLREIFQDIRFRKALSLAIDRQEISDIIYFGQAVPRQYTVIDESRFFKPEYANAYIEYDPERANELLDEMGLTEFDADGYRLRPDGETLTFTIEYADIETPKSPNLELVSQYWQELGIDVRSRSISGELQSQRAPANLMDATLWHGDKATDMYFPRDPEFFLPVSTGWERSMWPAWATWFTSGGESGEEPPEHIKELRGWYDTLLAEPDQEIRDELAHNILASQAENLWVIGTVGQAPQPVIVNNDLRNVPEEGYWLWDTLYTMRYSPEHFWLDR